MWDNPGNVRETARDKRSKDPRRLQALRTVSSRFGSFNRGVAQPGSAPALGAGGLGFESRRPDQQPDRNRRKVRAFPRNGRGSQGQLSPEARSITSPLLPRISRVSRNESAQKPAHRMDPLEFLPVIQRSSKPGSAGCQAALHLSHHGPDRENHANVRDHVRLVERGDVRQKPLRQ